MSPQIPFKMVSDACQKCGSAVILIGGHALSSRGCQRATLDVDFMITERDYGKLKPYLSAEGYRETARTNVAAKWSASSDDLVDIDFIFVDDPTFQGIKKESRTENYDDREILVPSVEHLIALKLHAIKQQPAERELKDLSDIVELIKANQLNVTSEAFKTMCAKFGTSEIYHKILIYTKNQ